MDIDLSSREVMFPVYVEGSLTDGQKAKVGIKGTSSPSGENWTPRDHDYAHGGPCGLMGSTRFAVLKSTREQDVGESPLKIYEIRGETLQETEFVLTATGGRLIIKKFAPPDALPE